MSMGADKAKSDMPESPDYNNAARQQSASSRSNAEQTNAVNRPNVNTPLGSQTWTQNPDGTYTQNVSLSPEQQGLYNTETQNQQAMGNLGGTLINNAQDTLSTPFDASKVDGGQQAIQDAIYHKSTAMLDPQYQQREVAQRDQLAQQGFQTGTAGFDTAMGNFNRDRAGAYGDARDRAIVGGQSAQAQAVSEALMTRNQPISEIVAMMNGSKATQPQFQATPGAINPEATQNLAATDMQGQEAADKWAQINNVRNVHFQALGNIGGGLAKMF